MSNPTTSALLAGAYQNFNLRFQGGVKNAKVWAPLLAMSMPSDTEEEIYAWMMQIPIVRKWIGERKIHRVGNQAYRLVNEDWEQTIAVSRNKLEDGKLAMYMPLFGMMGAAKAKFPDQQLARLLREGTTLKCWDGGAFFAASHTVDPNSSGTSPTVQNLFTSKALTADNFEEVYAAMCIYKGADGEVMGIEPDTLIVPPKLRGTAKRIVESRVQAVTQGSGAAAIDNVNAGIVKVVVLPEISSAYTNGSDTTWYLAQTEGELKPLIHQKRDDRGLVSRTKPDSDNVFHEREFQYGSELRAAFGYSFPSLMARCEA